MVERIKNAFVLADCFRPARIEFEQYVANIGIHERGYIHHAQNLFTGLFYGNGRSIDDPQVQIAGTGLGRVRTVGVCRRLR